MNKFILWLFIKTYEKLREYIVNNKHIESLIQLEYNSFEAACVPIGIYVFRNSLSSENGFYIKLSKFPGAVIQKEKTLEAINKSDTTFSFSLNSSIFTKFPQCIIAYWLTSRMFKLFVKEKKLSYYASPKQGMATTDNDRFLRLWFEVQYNKIKFNAKNVDEAFQSKFKWFPYNKGGEYRKWYGNNEYIVNYQNDGYEIKKAVLDKYQYLKTPDFVVKNSDCYFKKSITWSYISSTNFGVRSSEPGYIFDVSGSSLFVEDDIYKYTIGLLCTKLSTEFLKIINPTMNIQIGSVGEIPMIIERQWINVINKLVEENINLSKQDWDSFETSWDFKKHPLLEFIDSMPGLHDSNIQVPPVHLQVIKNNYDEENFIADKIPMRAKISDSFKRWKEYTDKQFNTLKKNEEELNRIFIDIYGLQDELTPEEDDKDVTIRKADQVREIKSLISYAVGCMFGRYSLDKEGLIYAGGDFYNFYEKFKRKDGGWAGSSMANYRVLNDNGKEIDLSFEVNNDNVIPITEEPYFNNDIIERFKEFIEVAYGKETLNENLDFIAETIGKKGTETSEDTIRRYFINDFFKDHVKTYQKRPIYWLFDSGKKNGFKALIYMHRYDENLVSKIRLDYLHRMQTTYEDLLEDINYKLKTELSVTENKEIQKKRIELNAKLQELKEYDEKIAHIANKRIKIDLDDGVKVNYKKFEDVLAKIK